MSGYFLLIITFRKETFALKCDYITEIQPEKCKSEILCSSNKLTGFGTSQG